MPDPRINLLNNLDYSATRVDFSSSPIVLLCGGLVLEKERSSDPDIPIQSLRHAITQANPRYEIFRPEEITTWQFDAIYKNLMDFEADLAGICSLVVIVLESPGSIAELGAFSQLQDLSKKLIVIKSSEFNDAPSFINLGILRFIKEQHDTSIKTYPWEIPEPTKHGEPPKLPDIPSDVVEDVIAAIDDELCGLPKSPKLRIKNNSHVMILICELIRIFVAIKEIELIEYLSHFNISISAKKLRRKLFLLKEFKIVKEAVYGDATFYIHIDASFHKIRFTLKNGKRMDMLRTIVDLTSFYKTSKEEKHRHKAIEEATKKAKK